MPGMHSCRCQGRQNKPSTWGVVSSCAQLVQLLRFTAALRGSSASPVDPGCPRHGVKNSLHFQLWRDSTNSGLAEFCVKELLPISQTCSTPGTSSPTLTQPCSLPIHPQTPHTHTWAAGALHIPLMPPLYPQLLLQINEKIPSLCKKTF